MQVGSKWDGKESIFRNYGGIIGIHDQPAIAIRMKIGRICHLDVMWTNPLGIVEQKSELKLDAGSIVSTQKLNNDGPIMPGKWTVRIATTGGLFVEKHFIVFPVMFNNTGEALSDPALLNAKRMTLLKSGMDAEKYMDWRVNVIKKGADLEEWLDKLVNEQWSLKSTCGLSTTLPQGCRTIPSCETTSWSSLYPDTKSELGPINSQGRMR